MTGGDLDPDALGPDEWADAVGFLRLWIPLTVGTVAEDTENGKRVLVTETHDEQANDRVVEALGRTVAEANPEYPEDDDVVTAVYLESLPDETPDQATGRVAREVRQQDFPTYDFPTSRLEIVSPDRISVGDFNEVSDQ